MLRQLLFVSIIPSTWTQASVIRVPQDEPTIQDGIEASGEGDTVLVAPGTYSGPGNERITFHGIDRVLTSETNAKDTVIYVTGDCTGIEFRNGETSASIVQGITVTNGSASFDFGGGMYCEGASPQIMHCIINNNVSTTEGGGIACRDCSPSFSNCEVSSNRSGGIFCFAASPTFANCTVSDNRGTPGGAGISLSAGSNATLTNCTVSGNTAWEVGGGLYCDYSSPILTNCVISGNWARSGGGGLHCDLSSPTLTNCIIWGNDQTEIRGYLSSPLLTYSNIRGGYEGEGNIDAPPLFRSARGFDFLLGPNSPCIDAGDPGIEDGISDWYQRWPNWYPNDARSDMGAYGGPGNWKWIR